MREELECELIDKGFIKKNYRTITLEPEDQRRLVRYIMEIQNGVYNAGYEAGVEDTEDRLKTPDT